ENPSYFEKAKDLRPTLYDEKVIGLGYTPMFLVHSDEALEIEKFKDQEKIKSNEVVSLLKKEKENLKTIESLKSKGFESSENAISESENQSENDCHVVEKECDKVKNSKVIPLGIFKLSVSQSVSSMSMSKTSCESNNVENLDAFSSVRRPKHNGVIWKKKWPSNTSNVDLSSVSHLKLNKNVNSRMCDLFDDNNFFIFDDESVRIVGR
nr:hypothetical protein [Tanacetum cinerariifolium]